MTGVVEEQRGGSTDPRRAPRDQHRLRSHRPPTSATGHRMRPGTATRNVTVGGMLRLHDTAQGRVVPFETREPGKVSMYVCGPTVYGPPASRARPVLAQLRRAAPLSRVVRATRSPTSRTSPTSTTRSSTAPTARVVTGPRSPPRSRRSGRRRWTAIGVKRPTHDPHATAYVDEMVELVGRLVDGGPAYETSDGVYFRSAVGGRLRAAGSTGRRVAAGRRPGRGRRREGVADRLRAVEEGQAGRADVAVAVGPRSPRLAHRVRGDVARPARRRVRPPRRRPGPGLPPPRERAGPGGGARQRASPATGSTTASSRSRARRCRSRSATSPTCWTSSTGRPPRLPDARASSPTTGRRSRSAESTTDRGRRRRWPDSTRWRAGLAGHVRRARRPRPRDDRRVP